MPLLFWINIIGLSLSILIIGSLTLLVVGVEPKNHVNRAFGFFTGSMLIWSGSGLLLRLSLWLEPVLETSLFFPNSYLWLAIASVSIVLMCALSLWFTVNYLDCRKRFTDLIIAVGILLVVLLVVRAIVNPGATIESVGLDTNGLVIHDMSSLAQLVLGVFSLYILSSFVLFMRERHREGAIYLALSLLILFLGIVLRHFVYAPFPILSFSNALSALMLAYGVINKQIFNPLKARTIQLNREIEERKKTEEELIEAQQRYKSLFNSKTNIVFVIDTEGNFIDANSLTLEIFGYKKDEIPGLNFLHLLHPDQNNQMVTDAMSELQNIGTQLEPLEIKMIGKDGKTIYILSSGTVIPGKAEIIGVAQDITEQKMTEDARQKLESQLAQAQKMEAIGTLAGGIAHDFNNILSAMIGYTELSQISMPEESQVSTYMNEILKAGNRAKDLVNQILTFSRQTGKEFKPVSINVIVKEALKLIRASLPTTIDIIQNIKSDSFMMGDPTQFHQIVMNLCTNAGHAMKENGGMLEVDLIEVDLDPDFVAHYPDLEPGPYFKLTVSDTGYGMQPEVVDRIFDPFFTTKEREEGTGMGLAVVHGIVNGLGGMIHVYSEPDKGTSFKVFLPRIESRSEPEKEVGMVIPKGTERILFIDDEKALIDIGKQMLESLGYHVDTRVSSVEALDFFRAKPGRFDLVITDMTMPQMTGDKLAGEFIAIRKDIPIIICTGFSHQITEEKAMELGIRGFLMKPIVLRDLANNVRKVLDEK